MTRLDPLLHHLHRRGGGSWSAFARYVDNFDADLDPADCARALAEHALVEFDFSGRRDWSVTGVQLIASISAIAVWGGTPRHLDDPTFDVEIGQRTAWIGRRPVSYDHAIRVRKKGALPLVPRPLNVKEILDVLPSIRNMIEATPLGRVPARRAARLVVRGHERRNPDGGVRRTVFVADWKLDDRVDLQRNGVWKLDRRTYIVTRNYTAFSPTAEAALWHGFAHAANSLGREYLAIYEDPILRIARFPSLPVPFVRALLLAGAAEVAADRPEQRQFTNVSPAMMSWLSDRLDFPITDVS